MVISSDPSGPVLESPQMVLLLAITWIDRSLPQYENQAFFRALISAQLDFYEALAEVHDGTLRRSNLADVIKRAQFYIGQMAARHGAEVAVEVFEMADATLKGPVWVAVANYLNVAYAPASPTIAA